MSEQERASRCRTKEDNTFNRVEYFTREDRVLDAQARAFIAPAKIARAKRRIKHYTARLAEAEKALIEDAQQS